ncbi:hypothetical protein GKODMF_05050 [Candidatus Electrothrix gigas]
MFVNVCKIIKFGCIKVLGQKILIRVLAQLFENDKTPVASDNVCSFDLCPLVEFKRTDQFSKELRTRITIFFASFKFLNEKIGGFTVNQALSHHKINGSLEDKAISGVGHGYLIKIPDSLFIGGKSDLLQ